MSPRDKCVGLLAATLASGWCVARAQTIGDYSRAQRLMLEATLSQAAARSAGMGASGPVAGAPSAATPSAPAPTVLPAATPVLAPVVQVSGVFAAAGASVAEVVVNATAYLLQAGQGVPGTSWHVESVAVDRVVLSRHAGGAAAGAGGDGARKVFALAALR